MDGLQGRDVAFLVAPEGVEEAELTSPWRAVVDAGGTPHLISTEVGPIQAFDHLDRGGSYQAESEVGKCNVRDYNALVLPGGVASPDYLRTRPEAVAFARSFFDSGKPVAAICHAPWLLAEAGVLEGRTVTSWPSLHTDLVNAGARWVDQEVQVCISGPNTLITSRKPQDLPSFNQVMIEEFGKVNL